MATHSEMDSMKKQENSLMRIFGRVAIVVAVVIVYAFGLQVTEVDLKKPQEAKRQEQLTNILRGLARPDLLAFETDRLEIEAPIIVPCLGSAPAWPAAQPDQPVISLSKTCADPGETITVSGSGFERGENVFIFFVPYVADKANEVELKLADSAVPVGLDGSFTAEVELKRDRDSERVQIIRAVVNRRVGAAQPSEALLDTVDKIIETVFLALLATTFGIFLAVPLSFLAARNLMRQVRTNFAKLMAGLILVLGGGAIGFWLLRGLYDQLMAAEVAAMLQTPFTEDDILGNLAIVASDAIFLAIPPLGVLLGAAGLNGAMGPVLGRFLDTANPKVVRVTSILLAALAGAMLFGMLMALINWFYRLGQFPQVLLVPSLMGAVAFAILGLFIQPERPIRSGMFIYYIVRTIMNVLRSIEPLLMVVAFAVWVGIGPFAGVMALALHTIVALGKLYSEQVENIAAGPIEAVTATGANRLQTIIYAVIPQIVPPYIAFTVYRWDINVRMSTIIGFGGGGGIGFLLSQNINLLKYRQASVNMIAIAIVVTSLDYISAKVRERIT